MITRWESVETILWLTAPPSATPIFQVKALSTPGVEKIIITDAYHWIRRYVIYFQIKFPIGHIKIQPLPKSGFVCFLEVHGNISFHTN